MRIAVLDKEKCKSKLCGFLCQKMCPRVRMGDETIITDEDGLYPVISEELCVGCGICINKCPFKAISIINLPEETGTPIHQYGKNGFRLYGLPIPRKGDVVGIIGVNGIGKSTALKILSGQIKPNLGNLKEEVGWDEILEEYRGNEVQKYLKSLEEGTLEVVYKPQYVDGIAKAKKGNAEDVLRSISSNDGWNSERFERVKKDLELESFLEKDVKTLSGGELQRLAIAVAFMRDADVYFFDEPTSYLDISQRLKVAQGIRKLAEEENKAVIVVEHDLIVLDYLSDYVHLAYGKKAAYGVFSKLKNTRVGINEYLSGTMKSENVRIRSNEIRFEDAESGKIDSNDLLVEYPEVNKKYPEFQLKVDKGDACNSSVIGVLGPNATGKTTWMKILTGEEKDDKLGELDLSISVSYKPQYIVPVKGTVREILRKATDELYKSHYKQEVLDPLDLEDILDNEVESLSGGELQRVAIAECISKDADIYMLDEPSAYLDVEQRLIASKVIKRRMENEKKAAVIIDHDIAFADYVSDKIMIFSGTPGKEGYGTAPLDVRKGMNQFLKAMDITFRRDEETKRPRANKPGSQLDKEQKSKGEYYYFKV